MLPLGSVRVSSCPDWAGGSGQGLHASRVGGPSSLRNGQEKLPLRWWAFRPQGRALGTVMGPSLLPGAGTSGSAPTQSSAPRVSVPGAEGRGPGLGPSERGQGHLCLARAGPALPCLCPPGCTWVLASWPGCGTHGPGLGRPLSPRRKPSGLTRVGPHVPVPLPAAHGTDPVPGCPALDASLTPCQPPRT